MNITQTLCCFREYRGWTKEYVAGKLEISLNNYCDFENGCTDINDLIAYRLSAIYNVPEIFFQRSDLSNQLNAHVIYSNCSFNGNGANGYILNNNSTTQKSDEVLFLRNEISRLNDLNMQLFELTSKLVIQVMCSSH